MGAHFNLGMALREKGDLDAALQSPASRRRGRSRQCVHALRARTDTAAERRARRSDRGVRTCARDQSRAARGLLRARRRVEAAERHRAEARSAAIEPGRRGRRAREGGGRTERSQDGGSRARRRPPAGPQSCGGAHAAGIRPRPAGQPVCRASAPAAGHDPSSGIGRGTAQPRRGPLVQRRAREGDCRTARERAARSRVGRRARLSRHGAARDRRSPRCPREPATRDGAVTRDGGRLRRSRRRLPARGESGKGSWAARSRAERPLARAADAIVGCGHRRASAGARVESPAFGDARSAQRARAHARAEGCARRRCGGGFSRRDPHPSGLRRSTQQPRTRAHSVRERRGRHCRAA